MNEATKKIIIACTLIFSLSALALTVVLFKYQESMVQQLHSMVSAREQRVRNKVKAPARVISTDSGNVCNT